MGKQLQGKVGGGIGGLTRELGEMIEASRHHVAQAANAVMTLLYWNIGTRIHTEVLEHKRASYGERVVPAVGQKLEARYGRGFDEKNLRRMIQFAETFPDREIVVTLSRQLGWSHFQALLPMKDETKREFYAEMCRVERWSVRQLRQKVQSMLFERTALSKKPDKLIRKELAALRKNDEVTPELVFQDPYLLDFLGLKDTFSEEDLEAALLREVERFLLELGTGFAFVARQKRIVVDGNDYYIDLLFYHRRMRRLVVVELKIGEFQPADAGQTTFYLRWVDRNERLPGEESPVAIILCAGKKAETVEYLDLGKEGIHVAEYLTELPSRETLRAKLRQAVARARARREHEAAQPRRPASGASTSSGHVPRLVVSR